MKRKALVFSIIAVILGIAGMAIAADLVKTMPIPPKQAFITGEEAIEFAPYYPSGLITDSPGITMGETQYDYQSNGSSGRRIAIDSQGGIHVAWMNGHPYPGTRHIYFNCLTAAGSPFPEVGTPVSFRLGGGYTQMDVMNDDRAEIVYHHAATNAETLFCAIDAFNCLGQFEFRRIPTRMGTNVLLWPYTAVDRSGRIHVVGSTTTAVAGDPQPTGYTRSNNGGTTWVALTRIDTLETISTIVVASNVSDKVAVVYNHPTDPASQWLNDVYYVQSENGIDWDFRNNKVNVTEYGAGGDSLFAYTDVSALYDYNDNLHLLWNAQYVTDAGIYYSGQLLHFDVASGSVHQIAQFDSTWPSAGCTFGAWNWVYAKMTLAVDYGNNLYAAYTSWDTSDCSGGGYANGDIYMQYSTDHGVTWSARENMTNSHTPGCAPGDCDADHWSSLAEKADTALHLFYVNDKDAGGIPQTEGSVTDNAMKYLSYHVDIMDNVDEDINTPNGFALSQNYPNPFNARTNIDFVLEKSSRVELAVYDLTGAKVATLLNGNYSAGPHQVNWDASSISSGVYYYTLKADGSEITRKMTLLK